MRWINFFLLAILIIFPGCDASVEPVREDTYSVYGLLSLGADQHFVRVKSLEAPLLSEENRTLDVAVTLENLNDGTRHILRDSTIVFTEDGDSIHTHNFWTDAEMRPKTEYRLSVSRRGEVVTSAETQTPTNTPATVNPEHGDCLTSFQIQFREAARKPIHVFAGFHYDGAYHRVRLNDREDVRFENPEGADPFMEVQPEREILNKEIPKKEQIDIPFDPRYIPRCLDLDENTIDFTYIYTSPDWSSLLPDPSNTDDIIRYVEETRVENGHGFFGAIFRDDFSVTVNTTDTLIVD